VSTQLQSLQGLANWGSSCFVHLYLCDMAHFAAANAAYCRHMPQVNPPSRACVQVTGPGGGPALCVDTGVGAFGVLGYGDGVVWLLCSPS
jgi:hypothetical protein